MRGIMADHDHYPDCHRHHMACALLRIWDLEKEVLRLTTQLQHARTGHLVKTGLDIADPSGRKLGPLTYYPELYADSFGMPCGHDHIEPPIHESGPTWAHRNDEPPSFTP